MPLNTLYALPTSLKRGFEVTELDWWNGAVMDVEGVGKARMTALPSQHFTVSDCVVCKDGMLMSSRREGYLTEIMHCGLVGQSRSW